MPDFLENLFGASGGSKPRVQLRRSSSGSLSYSRSTRNPSHAETGAQHAQHSTSTPRRSRTVHTTDSPRSRSRSHRPQCPTSGSFEHPHTVSAIMDELGDLVDDFARKVERVERELKHRNAVIELSNGLLPADKNEARLSFGDGKPGGLSGFVAFDLGLLRGTGGHTSAESRSRRPSERAARERGNVFGRKNNDSGHYGRKRETRSHGHGNMYGTERRGNVEIKEVRPDSWRDEDRYSG